jgi:hypothetical protein
MVPHAMGVWLGRRAGLTLASASLERKRRKALAEDRAAAGSFGIIGSAARVLFTLNVDCDTRRDSLREIPGVVLRIIEEQPATRFDRCHFARYGAASLEFEIVYYALSPDYNRYMDIQQAINLRIHEVFDKLGVAVACPTRSLWLNAAPRGLDRAAGADSAGRIRASDAGARPRGHPRNRRLRTLLR